MKRKQLEIDSDFYTHASTVCLRGRRASYGVAVTLSLCRNSKGWYFGSQASAHPVSKDRHQAHFLSLSLCVSDTVANIQWKNSALCSRVLETFSVAGAQ